MLCAPKVLRGSPLLLHASVACIPSSGSEISHLEAATPLVGHRPFSRTHRWYLISGVVASKCEISLPDYGGIHATKTCRRKGKTRALLLVLFSQ
jgi:hypothetical protein